MSIVQPSPGDKSAKRKPISKRVRYEVLRRDNNTCRYCHATDAPLTIDHVVPVVLGGTDDPSNLVAACKDCNAGKSSTSPDGALVAQVSDDAIRWSVAMKVAAEQAAVDAAAAKARVRPFSDFWYEVTEDSSPWVAQRVALPYGWDKPVSALLDAGMPMRQIMEAAIVALSKQKTPDNAFYYAMGVANNMLADLQDRAQRLIQGGAA